MYVYFRANVSIEFQPVTRSFFQIAVRVTKPIIPKEIMENYVKMENEKAKLQIAIQAQKLAEKEAETARRKLSIEAEARAEVSKIQQLQLQQEKESERLQSEIEDKVLRACVYSVAPTTIV